jgi:plasmid stabilization system protein ParE
LIARVTVRSEAWDDVARISAYIARNNLGAALRFGDAVQAAFDFLADNPGAGPRVEPESRKAPGMRFWPIKGFQVYLVLYSPTSESVVILAVVDGRRDWRNLL